MSLKLETGHYEELMHKLQCSTDIWSEAQLTTSMITCCMTRPAQNIKNKETHDLKMLKLREEGMSCATVMSIGYVTV